MAEAIDFLQKADILILLDFKNLNILNAKTKIFPAHSLRISVHTNGEIKFPISQ